MFVQEDQPEVERKERAKSNRVGQREQKQLNEVLKSVFVRSPSESDEMK